MKWDRSSTTPPTRDTKPATTPSGDPNRHLRELNKFEGPVRPPLPRQNQRDVTNELEAILKHYESSKERDFHRTIMEACRTRLIAAQREYDLASDHLDAKGGGFMGTLFGGIEQIVILVLDWALFAFSSFIVFSSITEKWRPTPEAILIMMAAAVAGLLIAVLVKVLAPLAVRNPNALLGYVALFAAAAVGDMFYLQKQGKLNVGMLLTALLIGLGTVTYFTAKKHIERPGPRRQLLRQYGDRYATLHDEYRLWQTNIDEMRAKREAANVEPALLKVRRAEPSSAEPEANPSV